MAPAHLLGTPVQESLAGEVKPGRKKQLLQLVAAHDYSAARAALIASVPGRHTSEQQ